MDEAKLIGEPRGKLGSADSRKLRQMGRLPAVLYGHGMDPVHCSVELREFEHLLAQGARVVDLVVNGDEARALIKELQYNALGSALLHADFQMIVAGERVELSVAVTVQGEPVGVVRDGGVLDQMMHEITVSCLPGQIPDELQVNVRELAIGDSITVADLEVPEDVTLSADPGQVVLSVLPPEEVPEEPTLEEAKEPELIGRGAEEEEEGAQAGPDEGENEA